MINRPFAFLAAFMSFSLTPVAQAEDILSLLARKADMPPRMAPDTIPYSYTLAVSVSNIEGKDTNAAEAVLRIDPTQPPGTRASIVSASDPESQALTDFLAEIEDADNTMTQQAAGFWCGPDAASEKTAIDLSPDSFTVLSDTETEAVLQPDFEVMAGLLMQSGGPEDKGGRKMMKRLMKRIEGEVTIAKPDAEVTGFRVRMTRPLTMMIVAKLKKMDVEQTCTLAPNGHYHLQTLNMSVRGKALGQSFGQDLDMRISELTPLP